MDTLANTLGVFFLGLLESFSSNSSSATLQKDATIFLATTFLVVGDKALQGRHCLLEQDPLLKPSFYFLIQSIRNGKVVGGKALQGRHCLQGKHYKYSGSNYLSSASISALSLMKSVSDSACSRRRNARLAST